jgi:translation initiation factor RLI1
MSELINNQEDLANIVKWGEALDELDSSAFAGKPVTDEEFTEIAKSYIHGTSLQQYLDKIRTKKQDLLTKIDELETIEKEIQEQITKQSSNINSNIKFG